VSSTAYHRRECGRPTSAASAAVSYRREGAVYYRRSLMVPGRLDVHTRWVDRPGPLEVRVRPVNVGLCHSDLHYIDGTHTTDLPEVLGHEAAGSSSQSASSSRPWRSVTMWSRARPCSAADVATAPVAGCHCAASARLCAGGIGPRSSRATEAPLG